MRMISVLVVRHVAWRRAKLGVGLHDFVHCLEKVLLGGHLASSADGEHAGLGAHAANLCTYNTHIDCLSHLYIYNIKKVT